MSVSEEEPVSQDLEFDMWEGQFEFLGGEFDNNRKNSDNIFENNHHPLQINGHSEGSGKSQRKAWCRQLNHHVQMLQQQMNILADNQNHSDERYLRVKEENAALLARVHMLEEQLREAEIRYEEKIAEEEARRRELITRLEREKQLEVENYSIRLHALDLQCTSLKDEGIRRKQQMDKLKVENEDLQSQVREHELTINNLKEQLSTIKQSDNKKKDKLRADEQRLKELNFEIEILRTEQSKALEELKTRSTGVPIAAHEELQAQSTSLKLENKRLKEAYDELFLTKSVEQGRQLLSEHQSLEAEMKDTTNQELSRKLHEAQEVITQLRSYIGGMLLNVVENNPELLEVKKNK